MKQIADVGSRNPIVARLQMQMFEIVKAIGLSKSDTDSIVEHAFVGSQWFLRAEKCKNEFAMLSDKFMRKAREGKGVQGTDGPVLRVMEPLNLGDNYQLFLIDLTIGLRLFFKAAGMILTGRATGWHELQATIEQRFAPAHPLRVLIAAHEPWSSVLYEDRGDIEHDPYMFTGFRVGTDAHGNYFLFRPVGAGGQPLEDIMEGYLRDGINFAEELVIGAVQSRLPAGRRLEEIPEPQRDPAAPVRFRVR